MNNVYFATLGCSKNEVDTEMMQGLLNPKKYNVISKPEEAEIIFVNTCGFINDAKEESINTILELATFKDIGQCKQLILTGCLAQRYPEELQKEIPEIDGIMGPGYMGRINEFLESIDGKNKVSWTNVLESDYIEGVRKTRGNVTQYLKISEGCNNRCSYCIIPYLRGNNRSRKIEDILEEAENLVKEGAKELILIGQNTTDYGIDLYGEYKLSLLLDQLEKIEGLHWIRLMYAYPDHFDRSLIESFKKNTKVIPYIDMPLQHGSEKILKAMNRRSNRKYILDLVKTLREELPHLVLRSTFIVGFPGEEEEDFEELLDFIRILRFDRVGAFMYSKEEGTKAALMEGQVPEETKKLRLEKFMEVQQEISEENLTKRIGENIEVLIEENIEDHLYAGRSYLDAPEIDGLVYVYSMDQLSINDFTTVKITESTEHDLIGVNYEYSK
ncbi:MAG: 30S ribosomal protein S12 methylthiotransferase RimO [Tissierellia bacterium]|nr:30S ribosomal protein S12 methylthiotransferase RimO [Tissierellia bacterium]